MLDYSFVKQAFSLGWKLWQKRLLPASLSSGLVPAILSSSDMSHHAENPRGQDNWL